MDASELSCAKEVIKLDKFGRQGTRNKEDYPVVSRNGRLVQMSNPINSLEGAVELWMGEFPNCQDFNIDLAIILLDKDVLRFYRVPCGIWDSLPRHPLVWRLMWSHYVCQLLGLPDPCNLESEGVPIVPEEIATAVQDFFDDEAKPPFWGSVPNTMPI
jgi:hypothetical protein